MGFFKELVDGLAKRQGFEAGAKGDAPRIFFSKGGDQEKAYYEGYQMGKESAPIRALHKASEKFLK